MEGRSIFITSSNPFIWVGYPFSFYLVPAVIAGIIFIVWIGWIVFYHRKRAEKWLFSNLSHIDK